MAVIVNGKGNYNHNKRSSLRPFRIQNRGYGRKSKYGNRRTELDGMMFDSQREANRWCELKLLERAGKIHSLERQVSFELIPAQKHGTWRPTKYVADFTYHTADGQFIVEDAKGMKTDVYKIKKKLMLAVYGIEVQEV